MAEVLFFTHRGIRCGVPSKHVAVASRAAHEEACAALWQGQPDVADEATQRSLFLTTPSGRRWVEGSGVLVGALRVNDVQALPPLVRRLSPLSHLVGLAIVSEEVVWLVDPLRFYSSVPAHAAIEEREGSISSGGP